MFQIKDFASIVAAQVNHARAVTDKITDFQPGSVVRTLMEAPAIEMEELYLQMFLGLRDAIPVATFLSFGFDKLPAAVASGFVSVSRSPAPAAPIVVPVGTVFSTADGRTYTSTAQVTWAAGASIVNIPVQASTAGLSGNVAAGVIVSSAFFDSTFNIGNSAITSGRDVETDAEREARFAEFIQSISRGTVYACMWAARQAKVLDANGNILEYVVRAGIDEEPGIVKIYLYSNDGVPSAELLANGQLIIDGTRDDQAGTITPGYRSAGVRVDILAMAERSVAMGFQVRMFPGYSLSAEVEQQMGDIFSAAIRGVQPGATLYIGTLVELLLAAEGVRQIVPITNFNVVCDVDEALVPGTLTITAL